MSDQKRNTFFHLIFCSCAKNSRFITSAGGGVGARVIKRMFLALEKTPVKESVFFYYRTNSYS
jgi:hypothetical protein